ncbi:MAG: GGDEF domain-containing protein [Gammaproteobacteria bacterium]|nr:GGDEF domain-containing protein [Gammaproteobacteria bacterium]
MDKDKDTLSLPQRDIGENPAWIRREQLRLLFSNSTIALVGTMLCAVAMVILLWPVTPLTNLLVWLGALGLLTLARLVLQQRYGAVAGNLEDPTIWEQAALGGILASGFLWGAVSIWLYPLDSPDHQTYIAFVLAGISAGAVTVYSPLQAGFLLFAAPALSPYLMRLLTGGTTQDQVLAGMGALFLLMLHRIASETGRNLRSLLELQTQNARLTHALHHQATHDSLVNLVNHGEFQRRLERLVNKSSAPHVDFSVIFIDLDLFKDVNDTGGHGAGDAMLKEVAEVLCMHTRSRDTAARVGGDEFALLLENCAGEKALQIAEHVRRDIASVRLDYEGKIYTLGASIGVTYGQTGLQSANGVLKAADAACYAAKESGRNRVRMLPADEMFKTTGRFNIAQLATG